MNKKLFLLISVLIFLIHPTWGQDSIKSKRFRKYQRECNFEFTIPPDVKEKKVKKLASLKYDLDLTNEDLEYSIRYSFFADEMSSDYVYDSFKQVNLMNLTQMDSTAVIYEFVNSDSSVCSIMNSNSAGFTRFDIRSPYGKGYQFCTMLFTHKHDVVNLFITILHNEMEDEEYQRVFDHTVNSILFKD